MLRSSTTHSFFMAAYRHNPVGHGTNSVPHPPCIVDNPPLFPVVIGGRFQSHLLEHGSPLGMQTCIPGVLLDCAR